MVGRKVDWFDEDIREEVSKAFGSASEEEKAISREIALGTKSVVEQRSSHRVLPKMWRG